MWRVSHVCIRPCLVRIFSSASSSSMRLPVLVYILSHLRMCASSTHARVWHRLMAWDSFISSFVTSPYPNLSVPVFQYCVLLVCGFGSRLPIRPAGVLWYSFISSRSRLSISSISLASVTGWRWDVRLSRVSGKLAGSMLASWFDVMV